MTSARLYAALASSAGRETHPMKCRVSGGFAKKRIALLDILAEVDAQGSEGDLFISSCDRTPGRPADAELLEDLELNPTLGQVVVPVDGYPQRDQLGVVVLDAVVRDGTFLRPPSVLSMYTMGDMPFYEGHARD